jgi:hypothetical protein
MDGTIKYHPEGSNPDPKRHAWYILTEKWIFLLVQKYRIPMIQQTDCKKFNKKDLEEGTK